MRSTAKLQLLCTMTLCAAAGIPAAHAEPGREVAVEAAPQVAAAKTAATGDAQAGGAAPADLAQLASEIGPLTSQRKKLLATDKRVGTQLAKLEKSIALTLKQVANAKKRKGEPSPTLAEKLNADLASAQTVHAELTRSHESLSSVEARMQTLLGQLETEAARASRQADSTASAATRSSLAVIDIKRWLKKPLPGKPPSSQEDLEQATAQSKQDASAAKLAKRTETQAKTAVAKARSSFDLLVPSIVAAKRDHRASQLEKRKNKLEAAQRSASAAFPAG